MTAVDEIEFIEIADDEVASSTETVTASAGPMARLWPLLVVVVGAVWFLSSTVGETDQLDETERLMDSLLPPVAPVSGMVRDGLGIEQHLSDRADQQPGAADTARWPSPPLDRDPYVVRIPGAVDGGLATLDRTLVYVNSLGDPTVVSFETGDVYEIDVAAIRVHETFAVEDGEVRSLEGANPGLADATPAAVVFHTFRDVDPPGVGTMGDLQGVGRGPELCLSDTSCARPGWGLDRLVLGSVEVTRFDPASHADVAEILDRWKPVDRWLVAPDGYRLPVPVGPVWVISPRGPGSMAGNGLL